MPYRYLPEFHRRVLYLIAAGDLDESVVAEWLRDRIESGET